MRAARNKHIRSSTASTIEMVPIESLIPDPNNARTHSEVQLAQLAASFRQFGWVWPILIDDSGKVIAGHARLAAAIAEGETEAKVLRVAGMTPAQAQAYAIADNQLALGADWNEDRLAAELRALLEAGVDIDVIGFSQGELDSILNGWASDLTRLEQLAEDDGGIPGVVTIRCLASRLAEIKALVATALEGMDGVEISSKA